MTPRTAASRRTTGSALSACRADGAARDDHRAVQPGVVYTTFHFPESGANVITTDSSDWATNCPEYKVTAVQVMPVEQPSQWQKDYSRFNTQQLEFLGLRDSTVATVTSSGK
jgi:formate dehydrogenase major subunit